MKDAPRIVVVGAGVSGLAAAHALHRLLPQARIRVLERESRAGGLVDTERTADGFVVDHGPDALVTSKPANLRALDAMQLRERIVIPPEDERHACIARGQRLLPMPDNLMAGIPASPLSWMRSPLLSLRGKARLCLEPLMPRRGSGDDESVADFVTRRFGREVLECVVDPLVAGIYGAPASVLSMCASMPLLVELERAHGSIARGMHAGRKRRAHAAHEATALPPIVSLQGGMATLTDTMVATRRFELATGVEVNHIERRGRGFELHGPAGALTADAVVLATPAYASAFLTEALDLELAHGLSQIPHGALTSVSMAWPASDLGEAVRGTGFIVPTTEGRNTTACSFMHNKWPGRAPEGHVLLRSFLRVPDAPDAEVPALALADLRDLLGVQRAPLWTRVKRRKPALPRYEVGHAERAEALLLRAQALGRFALAGNAYQGVGISECLSSGERAAAHVVSALAARA